MVAVIILCVAPFTASYAEKYFSEKKKILRILTLNINNTGNIKEPVSALSNIFRVDPGVNFLSMMELLKVLNQQTAVPRVRSV